MSKQPIKGSKLRKLEEPSLIEDKREEDTLPSKNVEEVKKVQKYEIKDLPINFCGKILSSGPSKGRCCSAKAYDKYTYNGIQHCNRHFKTLNIVSTPESIEEQELKKKKLEDQLNTQLNSITINDKTIDSTVVKSNTKVSSQ